MSPKKTQPFDPDRHVNMKYALLNGLHVSDLDLFLQVNVCPTRSNQAMRLYALVTARPQRRVELGTGGVVTLG